MKMIKSVLTAAQIKRLVKVAEAGDGTGPASPIRKLEELKLVETYKVPTEWGHQVKHRLTGTGRLAYRVIKLNS